MFRWLPWVDEHEHYYIIRRSQPYTRVSAIDGGKSSSIVFQPEAFDIVAYDVRMQQLRIGQFLKFRGFIVEGGVA